ncbi:hypothetical protein FLONG3_8628 [Fusarium longipes]|uniref:Uncharacterized protein n=1 Tax=Fusarium longipes TaxID=694270 RepID=A0A395S494_9HYPO|nr:hypothetical protein FLONG3_8628 [Fusarium longipes]
MPATNAASKQRRIAISASSIVASQTAAISIVVIPTPVSAKIMPRTTNVRLRAAPWIEVQNTIATSILASILTAIERLYPRAGVKESAIDISLVPHQGVPDMWAWMPTRIRTSSASIMANAR